MISSQNTRNTQIEGKIREDLLQAFQAYDMHSFNELCSILGDLLEERDDPEQRWCRLKYSIIKSNLILIVTKPLLTFSRVKIGPCPYRIKNDKRILCFEKSILLSQLEYVEGKNFEPFSLHIWEQAGLKGLEWVIGNDFDFDLLLP